MSADLRDRLDRLASDAPVVGPPTDLWRRGLRRRRRRSAAVLASAAAVLLVAAGGGLVTGLPTARIAPQGDSVVPTMPDRVTTPDPTGSDTSIRGEIGPLAVVLPANRKDRSGPSYAGVAAGSGRSRFEDLPAQARSTRAVPNRDEVALSPSGRWLAFWGTSKIGSKSFADKVVIRDTVTGGNESRVLRDGEDLVPRLLSWVSDDELAVQFLTGNPQRPGAHRGVASGVSLLDARTGASKALSPRATLDVVAPAEGGFTSMSNDRLSIWQKTGAWQVASTLRVKVPGGGPPLDEHVLGPRGQTLAGLHSFTSTSSGRELLVGTVAGGAEQVQMRAVPPDARRPLQIRDLLGWRDADHVLVSGTRGADKGVFRVDVRDGSVVQVVSVTTDVLPSRPLWANALWDHDPTPPTRPQSGGTARGALVGGAAAVLVAGVVSALWLWRRRGRA